MLLIELKRGLHRKSFILAIGIVFILCIINIFKYDYAYISMPYVGYKYFLDDYLKSGIVSPYNSFILFCLTDISNILFLIMPILVSMAYGDSYLEDLNSGFLKNILSRYSKKKYLRSKFLANFIVSGLTFSVPLIFNLTVHLLTQANIHPERMVQKNLSIGNLNLELYLNHPLIYTLIWIGIYFMFAGAISSLALGLSTIIKNKFVVLILPFIIVQAISIIFPLIGLNKYNLSSFLFLGADINIGSMIITFLVLLLSSFALFYIGEKANETF